MQKYHNLLSYILFVLKFRNALWISILIDTILLIVAITEWEAMKHMTSLVAFLCVFFGKYVWQLVSVISRFDFLFLSKYTDEESIVPTANIPCSAFVKGAYKQVRIKELSFFIESQEYNQILRSQQSITMHIQAKNRSKNKRVNDYISAHFDTLLPFLNHKWRKGNFINEDKLSMASEIFQSREGYEVQLCEGCYYASYLTNGIYNLQLVSSNGNDCIRPFHSSLTSVVDDLQKSIMGDHIGVSTLLITSDNYIVLLFQNQYAAINQRTFVPSGSGSVDWADYDSSYLDFRECILSATERELREEMFDRVDVNKLPKFNTKILGFYRDLRRGGKPEFYCETRVDIPWRSLDQLVQPSEKEQTKKICYVGIVEQSDTSYTIHSDSILEWKSIYRSASPTLLMCLYGKGVRFI